MSPTCCFTLTLDGDKLIAVKCNNEDLCSTAFKVTDQDLTGDPAHDFVPLPTAPNCFPPPPVSVPASLSVIPSSVGSLNVTFYNDQITVSHCVDSLKVSEDSKIVYRLYLPRTAGCSWIPLDSFTSNSFELVSVYGTGLSMESFVRPVTTLTTGYRPILTITVDVEKDIDSCSVILEYRADVPFCSTSCSNICIFSTVQII